MYNQVSLTDDQILTLAPSVFATEPKEDVSSKYEFIPTLRVLDMLRTEGWSVSRAEEKGANLETNEGFQNHLLRFRRDDLRMGERFIELVLLNSQDRSKAYQLMAGIFEMVCSNGLVVGDTFNQISVKHIGHDVEEILEASLQVVKAAPVVANQVEEITAIELTGSEREIFAESAALVLYDDVASIPFDSTRLLEPRRYADRETENNLWTTYNIVQENLKKGGIRGQKFTQNEDGTETPKRHTTRKIKSIDKDIKMNKALWNLTTKMKELKS